VKLAGGVEHGPTTGKHLAGRTEIEHGAEMQISSANRLMRAFYLE
jgi:hypothetical protein